MKKKSLNIIEVTYGQFPPELTITFNETIKAVDLNKIFITDIPMPNIVTGFKIKPVQTS